MKTIAYTLLFLLSLSFVGCEKVMNEDDALMEGFYVRSEQLENKSYIEVNELGDEFVEATTKRPELQLHYYYKPTYSNLKDAGYVFHAFTITGDDEWKGEIEYNP